MLVLLVCFTCDKLYQIRHIADLSISLRKSQSPCVRLGPNITALFSSDLPVHLSSDIGGSFTEADGIDTGSNELLLRVEATEPETTVFTIRAVRWPANGCQGGRRIAVGSNMAAGPYCYAGFPSASAATVFDTSILQDTHISLSYLENSSVLTKEWTGPAKINTSIVTSAFLLVMDGAANSSTTNERSTLLHNDGYSRLLTEGRANNHPIAYLTGYSSNNESYALIAVLLVYVLLAWSVIYLVYYCFWGRFKESSTSTDPEEDIVSTKNAAPKPKTIATAASLLPERNYEELELERDVTGNNYAQAIPAQYEDAKYPGVDTRQLYNPYQL